MREVRQALNMSQTEFGAAGGVLKNAQSAYETDKRSPDAIYLARIAELGVDVNYVVTGKQLSDSEHQLLYAVSRLTELQRELLDKFLRSI